VVFECREIRFQSMETSRPDRRIQKRRENSVMETEVSRERVFVASEVTKVYHMGEVDVHALRGVDLELGESELTGADERDLTRYRREHVGFVFQFYNLIPSLTARENVALVTEIAPDPLSPEEALSVVNLAERMDHFPAQLSGGEQQRVAIAEGVAVEIRGV
jgi:putative ABC transport system ATP-binding protein